MQSQTKSREVKLPEVHGISKNLDPNILPEKQNIKPLNGNEILQEKPWVGKGKAGMRRKGPLPLFKLLLRHQNCQSKFLKYQK